MLITSHEIAKVFSIFEASYGSRWRPSEDAIEVWFKKLSRFDARTVSLACETTLKAREHSDYPPTLPQFELMCLAIEPPAHRLLERPQLSKEQVNANRAMLRVVFRRGGVSKDCLLNMIKLKNALVEDADEYGPEFFSEVERQLDELAESFDR